MFIFVWGIESQMLLLVSGIELAIIKPVFDAWKGIVAPLLFTQKLMINSLLTQTSYNNFGKNMFVHPLTN
jgi:hypothetical protein